MIIIQQDSREKNKKHENIIDGFKKLNIKLIRSKNLVGDYVIPSRGNISVDIKQDMIEITGNLLQDHERFKNECKLAKECGIRLFVLIEEDVSLDLLKSGNYEYSKTRKGLSKTRANPITVAKIMETMQQKYGVFFLFTDKYTSPIKIALLLGITYQELLMNCNYKPMLKNVMALATKAHANKRIKESDYQEIEKIYTSKVLKGE